MDFLASNDTHLGSESAAIGIDLVMESREEGRRWTRNTAG